MFGSADPGQLRGVCNGTYPEPEAPAPRFLYVSLWIPYIGLASLGWIFVLVTKRFLSGTLTQKKLAIGSMNQVGAEYSWFQLV